MILNFVVEEDAMAPQTDHYSVSGIVSEGDVETARSKLETLRQSHGQLIARRAEITLQGRSCRIKIKTYYAFQKVRKFADDWMTRTGLLIPAALVGCFLIAFPLAVILSWGIGDKPPLIMFLIAFVPSTVAVTLALRRALFIPDDSDLESRIRHLTSTLNALATGKAWSEKALIRVANDVERADLEYRQTLQAFQSGINRLRQVDWGRMQGVEFEKFLANVFLELGYEVETTKATRDQGVDLIISKNGRRTAIQAKGYPASTVGNSAVQEANTGMLYYDCHACGVITNSSFTSSARDLANKVRCFLLDGNSIPPLIEGQIRL
jgi:hypothetical protein